MIRPRSLLCLLTPYAFATIKLLQQVETIPHNSCATKPNQPLDNTQLASKKHGRSLGTFVKALNYHKELHSATNKLRRFSLRGYETPPSPP